ncbi:NADP-dependent malic enzyme, mitochondrial [Galemys pyrenaicus]|uniref:NADP-dependent malic enzyme, mitochondrial n=1 Tax=Galemys pyrenaicus TaxID=202257 RepID=A0A8J6A9F6_GALPY|nr:NADP-dependent malic enzyme, mitochondrial [Galemys pyrenaicus]
MSLKRTRVRVSGSVPRCARQVLTGLKAPLTLVSPRYPVCARTMGAALGTGARLALQPRGASGAFPFRVPSASTRGCHSKPGPTRPVPLKKRGYDVTRNPHLNKVNIPEG